jgi:large subunit ribosomal protein L5
MARLKERYRKEIVPSLMKKHGYTNIMEVPRLEKIVVNRGVGEAIADAKLMDSMVDELSQITGQRPVITRAKRSVAAFKLRQGMSIGCKVTLRGDRMYEFLDRLVNVALPRVRDFKGVSINGMDGRGNFNLGLEEQIIFPEIEYDKVNKIKGMNVVFVTTARTNEESMSLLEELGMPFRN